MKIICVILFAGLIFNVVFSANQKSINYIETLVFKGEFLKAKHLINKSLKLSKPISKESADLFQLKGDINKLEGDIDEALIQCQKSNYIRSKIYKKGNYHLAWNYALLSNYHYEKINTPLAKLYADSCYRLIQNLSQKQQVELEIFKIWNILAQSFKQNIFKESSAFKLMKYEFIRAFYFNSINFIEKHNLPKYYLGKTYHLIGNSYFDNCYEFRTNPNDNKQYLKRYNLAMLYYKKALVVWNDNYGEKHYEKGKTLSIMALLNATCPERIVSNRFQLAIKYYCEANEALGVNSISSNYYQIPIKEDALTNLKYHTDLLLEAHNNENKLDYLKEANALNKKAIKLWEVTFDSFKSRNVNQNLAIYNLVPYTETLAIELRKRNKGLAWSIEILNDASQKIKYYDFTKSSGYRKTKSISDIKKDISKNGLVIDFLINDLGQQYFLLIDKKKYKIASVSSNISEDINKYNEAIIELNFEKYCKFATSIYSQLFKDISINNYKKIIICPKSSFMQLSFEALLVSKNGVNSSDYRKLDYLIKGHEIQYVLSTRSIGIKRSNQLFDLSAFAPINQKLSDLPFSKKFIEGLSESFQAKSIIGEKATIQRFLSVKSPIVHLSGHGLIDQEYSVFSGLVLADSLLTLQHIYSLKNVPSFVILNTCNSAKGKMYAGDGVDGFVRAFHSSGVQSTLSNLWEVDDQASNELFKTFYYKLNAGLSNEEALREAKLGMISGKTQKGYEAPYYWAGHLLIGENLVFKNEKTPNIKLLWILGVLGLVAVLMISIRKRKIYSAK